MNTEIISKSRLIQLSSEEAMNINGGSFGYDLGVALRVLGMSIGGGANTYFAAAEAAYIQYLNSD